MDPCVLKPEVLTGEKAPINKLLEVPYTLSYEEYAPVQAVN